MYFEDEQDNTEEQWPTEEEQKKPWPFKIAALLILAAFLSLTLSSFLQSFNPPSFSLLRESRRLNQDPFVQELRQSVVQLQVTTRSEGNRERRGTGFNINAAGLIVTNRHLVEDAVLIDILFPGQGTFRAESWRSSPVSDLAVIAFTAHDLPVVALEETIPAIGEKVLIIGNPLNFLKVAMNGEVANLRESGVPDAPLIEICAPIQPGNSGSPVFNEEGRVVAVVFATLESANGAKAAKPMGLALPVALLEPLLKE